MSLERVLECSEFHRPQAKDGMRGSLSLKPNLRVPCREPDVCSLLLGKKEPGCLAQLEEAKRPMNTEQVVVSEGTRGKLQLWTSLCSPGKP